MSDEPLWDDRLALLRREFDAAFASPLPAPPEESESLLLIRLGDEKLALRIREIKGFESARKIVSLPETPAALLGIAGLRGRLVPIYSLRALLRGSVGDEDARWLVLCGDDASLGLAFTSFEGQQTVARSSISATNEAAGREHVTAAVRIGGTLTGVVDIPSVLAAITRRSDRAAGKEARRS